MAIHWAARGFDPRLTRRIGVLFAIGSFCFFVGPFPGVVELVGAEADAAIFFVGSLFFTSAAFLQAAQSQGSDRMPTLVQFAGTIFFNVSTYRAWDAAVKNSQVDRLIWTPEAAGSACFFVAGWLAYRSVHKARAVVHHGPEWRVAAINLLGCVLFAISAVAGYVVPSSGDVLDLAAANFTTSLGGLCFLLGSLPLIFRPAALTA